MRILVLASLLLGLGCNAFTTPPQVMGGRRFNLQASGDPNANEDIIERLWRKVFGAPEANPFGLERMTPNKFPDQYPAVKDRLAEPVKGDSRDIATIRPLLAQTDLETRPLKQVYDASRQGWKAAAFHKAVDKKGPGVIVAKTKSGALVGGYNPKGWVGYGEYRPGISAFLFTWRDGDTSKPAIKLRKIGGAGLAQWDRPETGPFFGSDGLTIPLQAGSERRGTSKLGSYYERLPNGDNTLFSKADGGAAELTSFKAYVGVYQRGEEIPFDDAIPFSISE
ncbi:unnamed protein product [Chrysoparadoxa australica]